MNDGKGWRMESNSDDDWRKKRWPIPRWMLQHAELRLWTIVKKPGTSERLRKQNLKLLAKFRELRGER